MSHVTRTPLSRSKDQRSRSPGRFAHRRVGASGGCSGGRENVLAVGNLCYVPVCSAAQCASAPTGGGEGPGIPWRPPPPLQRVICAMCASMQSAILFYQFCLSIHWRYCVEIIVQSYRQTFTARARSFLSVGVRPSVCQCLSRLRIVARRLKISSNFFLGPVASSASSGVARILCRVGGTGLASRKDRK